MSETVTVVPVKGRFINGEPAVGQQVTPSRARALVATGAFIIQPPAQGRQDKQSRSK